MNFKRQPQQLTPPEEKTNIFDDLETDPSQTNTDDDVNMFSEKLDLGDFDTDLRSTPMEKHSDLLKELTNFDPFIREKFNMWLAVKWDQTQNKYVEDSEIEPVMNKKCAMWCVSFLKTYTRNNNIITTISKPRYNDMIKRIIETLWLTIGLNKEYFGIKKNTTILSVCNDLQDSAELMLMGAGGGKYNDLLKDTTKHNDSASYPQGMPYPFPQPKQGVFKRAKQFFFGSEGM